MLSEKIKELRKKKGLTQEDLANALNVSRQAITKWKSGDGSPDIENLKNIENIVLNKKYEKEDNILAQKELQEKSLPTDMFGRILNTNKEAKSSRIKQYLVNSTLTISVWTIFSSIATVFGKDAFIILTDLKIIDNITINNILNYILGFITGLLILFIKGQF